MSRSEARITSRLSDAVKWRWIIGIGLTAARNVRQTSAATSLTGASIATGTRAPVAPVATTKYRALVGPGSRCNRIDSVHRDEP